MIYSRSVVDEDLTTAYYNTSNSSEVSNSRKTSNSTEDSNRRNNTSAVRGSKVRTKENQRGGMGKIVFCRKYVKEDIKIYMLLLPIKGF
jgi:hypothetical protein